MNLIPDSYGNTVTPSPNTVTGNSNTCIKANITGLAEGTIYHFRVVATNTLGSKFGNDMIFSTHGTLTDIDGNVYETVLIGSQWWMAENLKTTRYRNGDLVGTTTPATKEIRLESTPKYQWAYNGDESNVSIYGRLYTWYAATDSRNICPTNWHIPSDAEWTTLTTYLWEESIWGDISGGKLKESGTIYWLSPNAGATNETGFTARPGGFRNGALGNFMMIGYFGRWWSSSQVDTEVAWYRFLLHNEAYAGREIGYTNNGFSVRCIKD